MPFVKTQKTNAYFSRFQVKYRRRREGKTDYQQRRALITQAKNKYASAKYRLVVRITNRTVICQIVHSQLNGDVVLAQASSKELPTYGISFGLTNWAACYATGLLVARRVLSKLKLDEHYAGVEEADGEHTHTEPIDGKPRPFKAYLDVGLKRTSTGARIFGAMKGASDGGIFVPHSDNRFPGFDPETKELDSEVLRKYIFGGHVAEYMESLEEEDDARYAQVFSGYIKQDANSDKLEDLYAAAHAAIRENPAFKPAKDESAKWKAESKKHMTVGKTREQREESIRQKIDANANGN